MEMLSDLKYVYGNMIYNIMKILKNGQCFKNDLKLNNTVKCI